MVTERQRCGSKNAGITVNFLGFIHDFLKKFREYSRMNFCSGMKLKSFHNFLAKFLAEKMQLSPRNYTNIAEINRKIKEFVEKEPGNFY